MIFRYWVFQGLQEVDSGQVEAIVPAAAARKIRHAIGTTNTPFTIAIHHGDGVSWYG